MLLALEPAALVFVSDLLFNNRFAVSFQFAIDGKL